MRLKAFRHNPSQCITIYTIDRSIEKGLEDLKYLGGGMEASRRYLACGSLVKLLQCLVNLCLRHDFDYVQYSSDLLL